MLVPKALPMLSLDSEATSMKLAKEELKDLSKHLNVGIGLNRRPYRDSALEATSEEPV